MNGFVLAELLVLILELPLFLKIQLDYNITERILLQESLGNMYYTINDKIMNYLILRQYMNFLIMQTIIIIVLNVILSQTRD